MADIGLWHPVKDTHAIQMAALSVHFAEPVNDRPWKRIEAGVSEAALKAGLTDKGPVQMFGVQILVGGGAPTVSENVGAEFTRRSAPGEIAEKAQVTRDSLLLENWSYTRWAPFKDRFSELFSGAFSLFSEGVQLSAIAATYIDSFESSAPNIDVDCSEIIDPRSKFVADGAFQSAKPWHTHSGWFEYDTNWMRRLHQVNIGVGDRVHPDGLTRLIQIQTVVTAQFNQPGQQAVPDGWQDWVNVLDAVQISHEKLKLILASVLTKEASSAISLVQQ